MYTSFTSSIWLFVSSDSSRMKVLCMFMMEVRGPLNSWNTMKMLKICSELPVIHMPTAFMGNCFAGAMASSQAFLSLSVSISSGVGGLRAGT